MEDQFGREIKYLRISVTDRCNLRCLYCMGEETTLLGTTRASEPAATIPREARVSEPAAAFQGTAHSPLLPLEQLSEIARAAAALGVTKVRLTGGEPLIRRGIVQLVKSINDIPEVTDLCMTTNGILLPQMAEGLRAAGLCRVNISLDTLNPDKFRRISRVGALEDTLAGIRSALKARLTPLKINTVLMGGVNDDEILSLIELTRDAPIELRFIELMPIGGPVLPPAAYVPCDIVLKQDDRLVPCGDSGTARLFKVPGYAGRIGLISPLTRHFCATCDRLRLTADGHLKPCLHSAEEIDISSLHGEALTEALKEAIRRKPISHTQLDATHRSFAMRNMNQIGG